ncbi:hypothetical protein W97_05088 [Coniosporium apollinis CBS 100218]|uniref:Lytic polysaccharide monooxygenase n=1 Tax=Coniosporium apollinis (strain CBS 100218) TaxID=1168221 RepID=R7YVZ3_CONA1|nr:uncharacterized protein W97_05088 [Coniosporium apollinis CBS 100218]EON65846.1 hypothetical protein W97_05088 [Coniosporium apollinis CBS 100218]
MGHLGILLTIGTLLGLAQSHMFMGNPPPFRWREVQDIEELGMPLNGFPGRYGQQPFPCKGHHLDIDGPGGIPGATWRAGELVTIQLFDSTNTTGATMNNTHGTVHSGGSCQIAFSYDKGSTWVVVQSYEGDCPRVREDLKGQVTNLQGTNQDFTFKVPETFPSGERVIVAWTWINASGHKEYYMSCSSVTIEGSGEPTTITPEGPPLLIANLQADANNAPRNDPLWSKCHSNEETSVIFPQRYRGLNPVIRAEKVLKFEDFPGRDDPACASDNADTLAALRRGFNMSTTERESSPPDRSFDGS